MNFVNSKLVEELGLVNSRVEKFRVRVASGKRITCEEECKQIKVMM